jgi:hypothetical protein
VVNDHPDDGDRPQSFEIGSHRTTGGFRSPSGKKPPGVAGG